ncbi:helix-turn-helix domain-containing protein [Microbacterium caowuchunii]|uniref:helix-turn-helix domain-containing protein n=1 Tax=Microbacterium caowuchunii TaxID=2614638 RepID=UPI001CD1B6BC|nr:helix-turn-helix domain-containing protein [Microbacterium caowuchunii]
MSATPTTVRRWGSIRAAAAEFGIHVDTVRRLISRGDIYAERIGPRLIRVDLDSLQGRPLAYRGGDAG